jgi:hypothetical protein
MLAEIYGWFTEGATGDLKRRKGAARPTKVTFLTDQVL